MAIPAWRLDPLACQHVSEAPEPRLSVDALLALRDLRDQHPLLPSPSLALPGAPPLQGASDAHTSSISPPLTEPAPLRAPHRVAAAARPPASPRSRAAHPAAHPRGGTARRARSVARSPKRSPAQLPRAASVSRRQSSGHHGRSHRESPRRQDALAERARTLGCTEVVTIDAEGGRRGPGRHERPGLTHLLAAGCQGRVGAVLALAASRLARHRRDWYQVLDLGAFTATVLLDADGV